MLPIYPVFISEPIASVIVVGITTGMLITQLLSLCILMAHVVVKCSGKSLLNEIMTKGTTVHLTD